MNLYQLKTFFTAARTLNFTEAAKKIYLTQSAVSHAIRNLEKSIKTELFRKAGKKLFLTETGELLYKTCETVFYELEKTEEAIAKSRNDSIGTIRIGSTVEFGTTLLVKHLKGFIDKNPGINVDFQFSNNLLKPLLADELDIIIDCWEHPPHGLEKIQLFREEYAVVASKLFLKENKIKIPEDLSNCNILSLDKNGDWWGNFLNALPKNSRPKFRTIIRIDHVRGIINAAIESVGIGFVPKYCILKELKVGSLMNVFPKLHLLEDRFYIYQKSKKSNFKRHRALINYLRGIKPAQFTGKLIR